MSCYHPSSPSWLGDSEMQTQAHLSGKFHVRLQSIYFSSSSCFRKMGSQSWLVRWPGWGLLVVKGRRLCAHVVSCPVYVPISSPESGTSCAVSFACTAIVRILENVQGLLWVSGVSVWVFPRNHTTISCWALSLYVARLESQPFSYLML